MNSWKTDVTNKRALILNNHPHSGEVAVCIGAEKTQIGIGMKFKSIETGIEFYVFNATDVQWLKN